VTVAPLRAWVTLVAVSAIFFFITATTFTSLGVVLPAMIAELHWGWAEAGLGFSLLGVFCGIASYVPAWLIRRVGVRVTFVIGALLMAAAFLCLANLHGVILYYFALSVAGFGFTLLGSVPGTYLLTRVFERPSFAFGLYFTIGGLGGVAGPLVYLWIQDVTGGWRDYWMVSAAGVLVLSLLGALMVDVTTNLHGERSFKPTKTSPVFRSSREWTVSAALRTPQFITIAIAHTGFLLCGITVNTISVGHLGQHGIPAAVAGGLLSLEALINAGARIAGGAVGDVIEPKKLLALSLTALAIGVLALTYARDMPLMIIYAAGVGIGYGLTFYAVSILLLNYFGPKVQLELFSISNLISTLASIGPVSAGWSRDALGSFAPCLLVLAAGAVAILVAVLVMRPPAEDDIPDAAVAAGIDG
jgi:MFS family permease